jgi:hypothetical protein
MMLRPLLNVYNTVMVGEKWLSRYEGQLWHDIRAEFRGNRSISEHNTDVGNLITEQTHSVP